MISPQKIDEFQLHRLVEFRLYLDGSSRQKCLILDETFSFRSQPKRKLFVESAGYTRTSYRGGICVCTFSIWWNETTSVYFGNVSGHHFTFNFNLEFSRVDSTANAGANRKRFGVKIPDVCAPGWFSKIFGLGQPTPRLGISVDLRDFCGQVQFVSGHRVNRGS